MAILLLHRLLFLVSLSTCLRTAKAQQSQFVLDRTASGRSCVTNCIHRGDYFCAEADFSEGVCCSAQDQSCRLGLDGICSFDVDVGNPYLACPFEPDVCGGGRLI